MNARLKKEFRSLLLPWAVGAAAAALLTVFILCNEGAVRGLHSDAWPFLIQCATFLACASIPLLAAMSFGMEYQHKTLPLLLAQPFERSRQWSEKLLALAVAALIVALICPVTLITVAFITFGSTPAQHLTETEILQPALVIGVLILTTVCSTGYWTMVARSIIGGLAFSAAAQFIVGVIVGFSLYKIYGVPLSDSTATGAVVVAGLAHSALFLWLGHRKFVRLQLTDIGLGERISAGPESLVRWRPAVLRCRADSPLLNLVRKELRLQKTVFVITGVLLGCWIVTLLLSFVAPIPKTYLEGIFGALVCGYVFLLPVLAGCLPQGEDRTLGLAAWHLTLPVSARLQWFVKLVVSVVVTICCGLLLPLLLLNVTAAFGKVDAPDFKLDATNFVPNSLQLSAVLAAIGLPFLLSFWAVSFMGNPVKSVVAAVIAVGALGSACEFGTWCAEVLSPIETFPVSAIAAWLQLPIYRYDRPDLLSVFAGFSVIVGIIAILNQSYIQFRRILSRPWTFARNAALIAILAVCLSFWCGDVTQSLHAINQQVIAELGGALGTIRIKRSDFQDQKTKVITVQDLERTGWLSSFTKTWLRNARITISISEPSVQNQRSGLSAVQAQIIFPNGTEFGAASSLFPGNKFEN